MLHLPVRELCFLSPLSLLLEWFTFMSFSACKLPSPVFGVQQERSGVQGRLLHGMLLLGVNLPAAVKGHQQGWLRTSGER